MPSKKKSVFIFFLLLTLFLNPVQIQSPMVYFYIASQLRETYEQFQKILTAKAIDHDSVVKGLASLTNGLQKIKTPLFIGAVMHLIQYWGEIFGEV